MPSFKRCHHFHFLGVMLLDERNRLQTLGAGSSRDIAFVAVGATVCFVATASGVGERATAVTTAANLTAGLSSWTLARTIGADDVLDALQCSCLSEEGKLLLALGAGSSRDVAFVAVGATVCFVAAASGVGERATAVTTAANLTAGLSSWTLARTIGADDVLDAICLGEERKFLLALGAGSSRDVTFVAVGATVCFVATASGVGERATAVTTTANLTAGLSSWTLARTIGADDVLDALQCSCLSEEGKLLLALGAGSSRDVTFVAVGATVCFVAAASGVGERATAVTTAANLTAGLSSWTLARTIGADDVLDALQCSCLGEERKFLLALGAGSSRDVTFVAVGATVCFVAAASGVGERATAVTTAANLTAGLSSWTLARTIGADDVLDALQCSCLGEERKFLLALGTGSSRDVTFVAVGATVCFVAAASGVGERATAVTTAANLTAGLSSWTLARTIGADDVLDAICLGEERKFLLALGAGSSRDVTFVAVGATVCFVAAASGVGERATAVTTAANLTAGLSSWTLARTIGADDVLDAICLGEERKFLLALGAGSSRDVTFVAVGATVCFVAAASGVGERATAVTTAANLTAGLSSWTLARTIGADDVLDAICLGEERKFLLALGAGSSRDVTFVAVGATVCFVAAASGVGERATAVTTAANLTAGLSSWTLARTIGADDVLDALQCSCLGEERKFLLALGAGSSRDVTFVAVGATVCFVAAASGVGERATAVTTAANLTAGLSSWTLARTIGADDVLDAICLGEERKFLLALGAGSSRDVTFVAVGATVCFVAAASGVGERATAVTTAANLTAGLSSWTLARTIGADDVLDVTNAHRLFCNSDLYQHKNGNQKKSPHSLLAANQLTKKIAPVTCLILHIAHALRSSDPSPAFSWYYNDVIV